MGAALQDPLNERFVLLSESCIPLYPASVVWAQLFSEPRSKIHACADLDNPDDEGRRMTYRLDADSNVPKQQWGVRHSRSDAHCSAEGGPLARLSRTW